MASIQGVYIALFGRPADPAGLTYFNGVTSNGGNLSGIGDLAGQKEYTDRFTGMSNSDIINTIYHSLFNRDAEPEGLAFFGNALSKGTLTVNNIAIAILDGAKGDDKVIIENKLVAADLFTKSLDTPTEQANYSGNAAADAGRAFLTPVGVEKTTIPSQAAIDNAITGIHGADHGGGDTTGDGAGAKPDIVLTTGDDMVSLTAVGALQATNADDIIRATHLTLGASDTIDGGLGNDTLMLKATGDISVMPHLTDVEKIVVNATGTGSTSMSPENAHNASVLIDLDTSTGYKELWSDSVSVAGPSGTGTAVGYAAVNFANVAIGTTLGVTGTFIDAPTTFAFKDAGGNSDAATLILNAAHGNGSVTIADIEDLTVDINSASEVSYITAANAKTVTITGNGDFNISGFSTAANSTIDASAHTGKLTTAINTDNVTIKGGSGDDSFTFGSGYIGFKITGGAGSDLFKMESADNIYDTTNADVLKALHVITDFDGAHDMLDIGGLGMKVVLADTEVADIGNAATLADALKIAGDASKAAMGMSSDSYASFVYKGDTCVYHDEGHDGYSTTDGVVQLVGFTGTLDSTNFVAGAAM